MNIDIANFLTNVILNRALYVAANLNIAEELATSPMSLDELANTTQTDKETLNRLLYFLELYEVFKKNADEKYELTPFSEQMREDHPDTIKFILLHDDETRWNSFGHLEYSIQTGKASFDKLHNMSYFEYLKKHPQLSWRFDKAMTDITIQEDVLIAQKISFKGVVADIGGGQGQLLTTICRSQNIKNGILFDLPNVVAQANELGAHCQKIGGSFFEPLDFAADTFILKRILHDWEENKAEKILKNISNAMHSDSTLYIFEGILDRSKDKQKLAAIDLALLTVFEGKERTLNEFEKLVGQAGLEITNVSPIDDLMCALECKKKSK
jgi:O-methyltransferase domain